MSRAEIESALHTTHGNSRAAERLLGTILAGPQVKRFVSGTEFGETEEPSLKRSRETAPTVDDPGDQATLNFMYDVSAGVDPQPLDPKEEEDSSVSVDHIVPAIEPQVPTTNDERMPGEPFDPPSTRQLNELTEYFLGDYERARGFSGSYLLRWGWLLWLQDHLPDDVLCLYRTFTEERFGEPLLLKFQGIGPLLRRRTVELIVNNEFILAIQRCREERPNARFVIGLLALPEHDNGLIFDFKKKKITRFEPHGTGTSFYDPYIVDRAIKTDLIDRFEMFQDWKYKAPFDFCPISGPQGIEELSDRFNIPDESEGYCAAWATLFLQFRVMNPELSDRKTMKWFTDKTPDELALMVRQYAAYIVSKIDQFPSQLTLKLGDYVRYHPYGDFEHHSKPVIGQIKWVDDANQQYDIFVGKEWPGYSHWGDEIQTVYPGQIKLETDLDVIQKYHPTED